MIIPSNCLGTFFKLFFSKQFPIYQVTYRKTTFAKKQMILYIWPHNPSNMLESRTLDHSSTQPNLLLILSTFAVLAHGLDIF